MTGTVGESLRVQCQYEEKHKAYSKYWCRVSRLRSCQNTVKTRASKEARNGRVSIRDDPATLTFTVTLDNLTLEDAGTYMCGVDIPLINGSWWEITPSLGIDSYSKVVVSVVPDKHLALLLFLLAGASLLVWRMFQKRQMFPKEELHYASVAFDSQRQGSHANGNSPCLPQDQKAEYSEVRKPREGLSDPHL
ncbi:CMRF35-like molecule 8-like protein [Cricetulus griseus]|nr:CMRF35-like molecule 8-like protein [Cricetulus griseus]